MAGKRTHHLPRMLQKGFASHFTNKGAAYAWWYRRSVDPDDWKPMPTIGAGVREIRVRESSGAFRCIYLATRPEGIYVLHCFQKKTRKTRQQDLDLAHKRFKSIQVKS
jgi:phage-related protein